MLTLDPALPLTPEIKGDPVPPLLQLIYTITAPSGEANSWTQFWLRRFLNRYGYGRPVSILGSLTRKEEFRYNDFVLGEWRSLVARLLWEQEAAGSNPVSPTRERFIPPLRDFPQSVLQAPNSLKPCQNGQARRTMKIGRIYQIRFKMISA